MKAAFTQAIRWQITATCRSPLRTGGADGDTESVLRDHRGRAIIQGSSIAGSLREWLSRSEYRGEVGALFGSREKSGSLRISDGVFSAEADTVIRPRLKLDGKSGTAEDGKKFDLAHVAAGSRFTFSVVWLGGGDHAGADALEAALGAIQRGEIALGAQRTNGFGLVSLEVTKRSFDLGREDDRAAWLEDAEGGEALALPEGGRGRQVIFTAVGSSDSLLVKASQPVEREKGSYTENITEAGRPVLPGSSLKGALRARAEAIAEYMGLSSDVTDAAFGYAGSGPGNGGSPGRIRCEDVSLEDRGRVVTRIRIDKFTGGVMRTGLFKEKPLSGSLVLRVKVDEDCPQGCALVLYALRDLGLGLWTLGSGASVGRGRVRLRELTALTPEGARLTLRFGEDGGCLPEDPAGLAARWYGTLKEAKE